MIKTPPWLTQTLKNDCHAFLGDIFDHSATPSQFEEICEKIRDVDDARKERGFLIDRIYQLVGAAAGGTDKRKLAAIRKVYEAFWKLETAK